MTGSRVAADWAWISKDPAVGIAYSVLRASSAELDFGALMGRYVPGSPSAATPESAPEAPPWITLGPVGVSRDDDDVIMSVSVRDPWRDRDHAGRPVWPQRLLVVRFAELSAAQASYQTLWEAVRAVPIPDTDGAPLAITIQPQSPADLLPFFDEYGFETLAMLAATLLERPVAIADGSHLSREQRLAVFDAVSALLPYGLRAALSVSSSVNNTTQHGIRLVFADFANDGQQLVSLLDRAPVPGGAVGQRYLAMLRERAQTCGLAAVLEHLWRFRQPCSFDQSEDALTMLAQLDFIGGMLRALSQGPISLSDITDFLAHDQTPRIWKGLDARTRDNALTSLLVENSARVAAILARCWKFLGGDVTQRVNRQLDVGDLGLATWCLGVLSRARSGDDRLLGDLLVPDGRIGQGARWDRRFSTLVELMRRRPVPAPGNYPYACDQLRYAEASEWQARLVRELLTRELTDASSAVRARDWAGWLCGSPFSGAWARPDWVAAMDFLVLSPAGQGERSVRAIISQDAPWTLLLLRLGSREGRLGELVTAASESLIELAGATDRAGYDRERPEVVAELRADLRELGVRAGAAARVDAVLVLSDDEPRNLPVDPEDRHWAGEYLAGLRAALALDAVQKRVPDLEQRFLTFALSGGEARRPSWTGIWLLNAWAKDPERKRGLVEFILGRAPESRPLHGMLDDTYWNTVGQHPELVGYAAFGDLLTVTSWTVAHRDGLAFLRHDSGDGVLSTRLARACYEARRAGLTVEEIMRALAEADAASIPAWDLDNVLREFQGLLFQLASTDDLAAERQASERDLFECYGLIVDGGAPALGAEFAEEFGDYLDRRLEDEIKTRQEMREELSARRRSRGRGSSRKGIRSFFSGPQSKAPGKQDGGAPRSAQAGAGTDPGSPAEGITGDHAEGSRAHRP